MVSESESQSNRQINDCRSQDFHVVSESESQSNRQIKDRQIERGDEVKIERRRKKKWGGGGVREREE